MYLNPNENHFSSFSCNFFTYNNNILHFILIVPYIFRALRLLSIFRFNNYDSYYQKSKLKEFYYLKLTSLIFIATLLIYLIILLCNVTEYVFPIDLIFCSNSDKELTTLLFFKYFWNIIHLLESLLLFILLFKLKRVKDEFNISDELCTIGLIWLVVEVLFLVNGTISSFLNQNIIIIIHVIRNFLTVIISGLLPVIKSFKVLNLPICTTKECASNFNLLLITEKTYDAFYTYLRDNAPAGTKLLSFWTELNVFKHSRNNEVRLLSTDIYGKYLLETSDMYIDFPAKLVVGMHSDYTKNDKSKYSEAFDSLGEYAYNTLRDYYYPSFKVSPEFKKLEEELERDEIIYSRLVASSMISSIELE